MSQPARISQTVTGEVRIIHTTGLHARPSVMFTRLAKTFNAMIYVADNAHGPWINAKSIVKVMGLKAPFGTTLFIRSEGCDAELAVKHLSRLIEDDFEENETLNGIENVNGP